MTGAASPRVDLAPWCRGPAPEPETVKWAPDQGDLSPDPGTGGPNPLAAAPSPAAPPEREGSNWAQLLPIQPGEHRIRPRGCRILRALAGNGRRRPAARRADGGGRRWGASSRGDNVEVGTPRRRRPSTRTDFRRGAPAAARGWKEARGLGAAAALFRPSCPWGRPGPTQLYLSVLNILQCQPQK